MDKESIKKNIAELLDYIEEQIEVVDEIHDEIESAYEIIEELYSDLFDVIAGSNGGVSDDFIYFCQHGVYP